MEGSLPKAFGTSTLGQRSLSIIRPMRYLLLQVSRSGLVFDGAIATTNYTNASALAQSWIILTVLMLVYLETL